MVEDDLLAMIGKQLGLGSNESTCETPPLMKRKITDLAFAGKCGCFGATGLAESAASAARSSLSNPGISIELATADFTK